MNLQYFCIDQVVSHIGPAHLDSGLIDNINGFFMCIVLLTVSYEHYLEHNCLLESSLLDIVPCTCEVGKIF